MVDYVVPQAELDRLHKASYGYDTKACDKCGAGDGLAEVMFEKVGKVIIHESDLEARSLPQADRNPLPFPKKST